MIQGRRLLHPADQDNARQRWTCLIPAGTQVLQEYLTIHGRHLCIEEHHSGSTLLLPRLQEDSKRLPFEVGVEHGAVMNSQDVREQFAGGRLVVDYQYAGVVHGLDLLVRGEHSDRGVLSRTKREEVVRSLLW
jgi:hypothetical protein